jgi:hypothetical protein
MATARRHQARTHPWCHQPIADAHTKPLDWILHHRYVRQIMGHHGLCSTTGTREQPAIVLQLYSMTMTLSWIFQDSKRDYRRYRDVIRNELVGRI